MALDQKHRNGALGYALCIRTKKPEASRLNRKKQESLNW